MLQWQFYTFRCKFTITMDPFDIPVTYKGKEIVFPAELLPMGYTYKIKVTIDEIDVLFEPDEEKNYRATVSNEDRDKAGNLNKELLQLISETLHTLLT